MQLSRYVKKIKINENFVVLNNSLSIKQVYLSSSASLDDNGINKKLIKDNYLINNPQEDVESKEYIISNSLTKEFRLLRILLTDLCNLNCKYCKVCNNTENIIKTPAPFNKMCKAIDLLFSKKREFKLIHITGGEPLIFFNEIKEVVDYIENKYSHIEYKYIIVVGTNGILLDERKALFFKKYNIKVIISLDGDRSANILRVTKNGKSSFEEVIRGIAILKSKEIELGISMVVGKQNIESIGKNIDFIINSFNPSSFGVNFIKSTKINAESEYLIDGKVYADSIYNAHLKHRNKGIFLELLARKLFPFVNQKYRAYDCGASNGTTININASGNLGSCKSFLCLKSKYEEDDINRIINDFKKRSPIYNDYCKNCFAQGICGNGCAYEAEIYDAYKIIDKRSCAYVREFYLKFLEDLFELNREKALFEIKDKGYYVPSREDRIKMLGAVRKDYLTLRQCIGHEI